MMRLGVHLILIKQGTADNFLPHGRGSGTTPALVPQESRPLALFRNPPQGDSGAQFHAGEETDMGAHGTVPTLARAGCLAGLLSLSLVATAQTGPGAQRAAKGKPMQVASRDGTSIAFEKTGTGPALIVVGGALSDRSGGADLAQLLAPNFTVYTYDRRGRGDSGDTKPHAVAREVEDLDALVGHAGGSAYVYGKSSGAALALQAAATLGPKVTKLALYEAPYNEAPGAAQAWRELTQKVDGLLAKGQSAEAVAQFMRFVGLPEDGLAKLKASPAWAGMVAMAPTLAYDNAVLGDDRSVPSAIAAKIKVPTLVMDGGASAGPMPFMRPTADKLGKVIPGARRQVLEGQAHDVDAKVLAPILTKFFREK